MISEAAFVALVWGSVAVVLAVFAYEVYVLATDLGWFGGGGDGSREWVGGAE